MRWQRLGRTPWPAKLLGHTPWAAESLIGGINSVHGLWRCMVDVSTNVCCHAICARRSEQQIAQPVIVAVVVAHVLGGQRCAISLAEAREHIVEERVFLIAHAGQRLL